MIAFDVAPVFTSGDKLSLVARNTDHYDPAHSEDPVGQFTVTDAVQAEVYAEKGSYWLVGERGQTVGVTVPEGHAAAKPAKKAPAKK